MFDLGDPETFWLNVTNIALGLVTFICCAVIGRGIYKELRERAKKTAFAPISGDDHAFLEPQLGIIMADGGEKISKSATPDDESHIIRSEN